MIELNQGIAQLQAGSVSETLYTLLLAGFETAAAYDVPDFSGSEYVADGVVNEAKINADLATYQDISRKNSAFMFASSIISAIMESDLGSGMPGNYVLKTGDSMAGNLNARFGFSAGLAGNTILSVFSDDQGDGTTRDGVTINGELRIGEQSLYMGSFHTIGYSNNILAFHAGSKFTFDKDIEVNASYKITVGLLQLSNSGIRYNGQDFYHTGNANKNDVSWTMLNGTIAGNLEVTGTSTLNGAVSTYGGITHYIGNIAKFSVTSNGIRLNDSLNIVVGGIQFDGNNAFYIKNSSQVSLTAPNYTLLFGEDVRSIVLLGDLYDATNNYKLIGKYGDAYFPMGFRASYNKVGTLIQTYADGVIFSKSVKLYDADGPAVLSEDGIKLTLAGEYYYTDNGNRLHTTKKTSLTYELSNSYYTPLNSTAIALKVNSDADFIEFNSKIEANQLGIVGSYTKISDNQVFFRSGVYFQGIEGAVKLYGDMMLENSVGSFSFSSGFAGSGWRIYQNVTTGNSVATFDELVVRKKMRAYELEIQKISATNGSLWVSDSCSGDFAVEIS